MKSMRILAAGVLVLVLPAAVKAQSVDGRCSDPVFVGAGHEGGDACQKVVDIYRYLGDQLGTLIAGGSAVMGRGGTLGGFPHFNVELRANIMRASIPDVEATGIRVGEPRRSTYAINDKWVAIPQVDASLGIFRGIPVGVTYVGGVDAIASAAYVADVTSGSVSITSSDGSLRLGYGARVGIMGETALTPGVSVTYLERRLPTIAIIAREGGNSLTIRDADVKARSWRVVASKSFVVFGVAAGIGQDHLRASSVLDYDVEGFRPDRPFMLETSPTRTNMFVDLSVTPFPLFRLVGELGRVSGGDVQTYNRFDPAAEDARVYGSVGVRVGY
ncbi:MAG TPA: hypothetical protein VFR95_03655 [Gemmatimonadaceae bacterium]|nr:hypothetical protein [Gemmatimonadaceae bacterium]